jgi:hypothetical protein
MRTTKMLPERAATHELCRLSTVKENRCRHEHRAIIAPRKSSAGWEFHGRVPQENRRAFFEK